MNEFIENLKTNLDSWGELAEVVLNAFSLIRSIEYRRRVPGTHPLHTNFRLVFGGWLVVALEFQLAADIVGTIVSPTAQHLIELGAIAVIRTFLNYFLGKELKEERETLHPVIG